MAISTTFQPGSLRTRTRDEWANHFSQGDACVSPGLSMHESMTHPHAQARRNFLRTSDDGGSGVQTGDAYQALVATGKASLPYSGPTFNEFAIRLTSTTVLTTGSPKNKPRTRL